MDFLECKLETIKIVKAVTGLTANDARDIVQAAPAVVAAELDQLRERLIAITEGAPCS